ncbi:MAG: ATP-dependent helicase UvrD/PcrA [Candidatus Dependentiae bacterium]|nr:ATP-dependent helicase UvrD/PcrA [Candidatus Dependentiae bacterium]
MIIAGAGSGKTRVIASRIAYLLSHYQVPASAVVALTFTNKAGSEMKERIKSYLPHVALPFVGTFHSYCVRLLRHYSSLLPFSNFSILDTEDQRAMLKKIMEAHGVEKHITPSKMQGLISLSKNHLPGKQPVDIPTAPFFNEVLAAYEKEKSRSHAYDFDDLLIVTLDLLKKNPSVTTHLQSNIRHLLVDEYQDTNQIQHELLRCLAFNQEKKMVLESICAVGDQDQSIYSWRGAQADNMQRFCDDFAPVRITTIEQNYRSVKPILDAANNVIMHNRGRIEKKLWSAKIASDRLLSVYCQNGGQEANTIAQTIQIAKQKIPLNNVAILYRTHHQSRSIEEAFMLTGIAYTIIGGIRFYERKEVKDLLGYLKLLVNRFDRPSFLRVVNTPTRGIGDKCIELALATWEQHPSLNSLELLTTVKDDQENGLNKTQRAGFVQLHSLLSFNHTTTAASTLLDKIVHATDYMGYLRKNYTDQELTSKLENVQELLSAIRNFEQEHPSATLPEFLEHVMLMQEQENSDDKTPKQQVKMMTLHSAKGLEFDFVVLCGMEEQLFPSARALYSNNDMEEERRLMYVGLTRAREYVLLTHSEMRTTYGTSTHQEVSRFVSEIPATLLTVHDTRQESPFARTQRLSQWLGLTPPAASVQTYGKTTVNIPTSSFKPRPGLALRTVPVHKPKSPTAQPITMRSPWLVRMPVRHETFGIGLIQEIEFKGNDEYFLTISFKSGVKKLSSRFVTRS